MRPCPSAAAQGSLPTRVVALGQRFAGDDGVALVVLDQLRARVPTGTGAGAAPTQGASLELCVAAEPSQLLDLLCGARCVWLVDAVVGAKAPGEIYELSVEDLCKQPTCSVSSHGLDVAQTLELAAALLGEELAPNIHILAISIEPPQRFAQGLSPEVAAAAERCVDLLQGALCDAGQG